MRYRRGDVVERAIAVLDEYGLADLSMRRIATELGLQPSALYHHFASKQVLLAAVADEILARGWRPSAPADAAWDAQFLDQCRTLRNAMLAYRDGAELVATVYAFRLGAQGPHEALVESIRLAGFDAEFAHSAAATALYFVFGYATDEQTHVQAGSVGAIDSQLVANDDAFTLGLALILDGIRLRTNAAMPHA